jgi:PAS domain S-box-containing protein
MKRRAWIVYLGVGISTLAAFLFTPVRTGALFNLIAISGAIAILIGIQINEPKQRLPWYLFALGQTFFVTGDVITYNYDRLFGTPLPFPSIGDFFYLAVYPCLIAGLLLLIRRRTPGGDRESALDSLIVAIGVGAVSWVFIMAPIARDSELDPVSKLVTIAYPLMDLMILTAAVRLAVGTGKRPPAFYLMIAAVVSLFVTDSIYSWISAHGIVYDNSSGFLEGGWGLFYVLWGTAALHPSMRLLDEPTPVREVRYPRRRLYLLAGASLMAPIVMVFQATRGEPVDVPVLAVCSGVLFILVLIRLNGLMVDVTEHRRTERQLREAETKYRTLVEGLPAVVYIAEFGAEGPWRYVSPQIESVLGFTQEEFMSAAKFWRDRILPEDREQALAAELQVLSGGQRMRCEYRILSLDGRVIWIREEAEAIEDESGHPAYLQGVMYDVTQEKQAEERLLQALETEKEATSRLRALHEMQNSFLQAVSHDLRTPLTSIMGNALTLERGGESIEPSDRQDLIRRMAVNARKLHRLLTNLLDLDRMSRGVVEPNREAVNLTTLAEMVIEEAGVETHPIELLTKEPVLATVDAAQTERIIENLVTNAVRYTPEGTPIWVSVGPSADGVVLKVDDAGPGIREDLKNVIFEPFRQGDETVSHSPGVGIGLSLVARFAQLHGGRAWVEDREGGGSSFRVFLPNGTTEDRLPAPAGELAGLPRR